MTAQMPNTIPNESAHQTALPTDIASLSFEKAMTELEQIIRNLEGGKVSLEDSIAAYERGASLKKHCEAKLNDARMKIEKISLGPNGTLSTQPFEE